MTSNPSGGHAQSAVHRAPAEGEKTRSDFTNQFLLRAPVWTRIVWQTTGNFILLRAHTMPTCRPRDPASNLQNMQGGDLSGTIHWVSVYTGRGGGRTWEERRGCCCLTTSLTVVFVYGTGINSSRLLRYNNQKGGQIECFLDDGIYFTCASGKEPIDAVGKQRPFPNKEATT